MNEDMPKEIWLEPDGDEIIRVTNPDIYNHPERFMWDDGTPMIWKYIRSDKDTITLTREDLGKIQSALAAAQAITPHTGKLCAMAHEQYEKSQDLIDELLERIE